MSFSSLSLSSFLEILQPINRSGGNALLPAEGKNATASLFALIVQAELKGNSDILFCSCCFDSKTIFPAFLFNYQSVHDGESFVIQLLLHQHLKMMTLTTFKHPL